MLKIAATILFTLSTAFAGPCQEMKRDYAISCQKARVTCENLGKCKEIRNECNQNVKTHDGCSSFISCVDEKFKGVSDNQRCVYQWSGQQPVGTNKCENMNYPSIHLIAHACPGFEVFGDMFADKGYDCKGTEKRFDDQRQKCNDLRNDLQKYCMESVAQLDDCSHKKTVVNISDETPQGIATTEVDDKPRVKGIVYDFTQKYLNFGSYGQGEEESASAR